MKTMTGWQVMFMVAAAYDGLLGVVFMVAGPMLFSAFGVEPPNHWGYVQFPGALLLIFGFMFARIAADPRAHRGLMDYGILLKVAYCGVVGAHWFTTDLPFMWKPFWVMDLIFLILFLAARLSLRSSSDSSRK